MYRQGTKRPNKNYLERSKSSPYNLNSVNSTDELYNDELNWYNKNPTEEITIEEFESFAGDRLTVLKALEAALIRNKSGKELEEIFLRVSREHLPLAKINKNVDNYPNLRKDHLSHFILRLAFCKSQDLRAWFVRHETQLFMLRYSTALPSTKTQFIEKLGSGFEKVSDGEKLKLKDKLEASKFGGYGNDFEKEEFFKIPFEKVSELVSGRQVFLKGGYAYVPKEYSQSWIVGEFKMILERGLMDLHKALPQIGEDKRLLPILQAVSTKSYSNFDVLSSQRSADQVSAQDVPKLSVHFPLCMKNIHNSLKKDKHLKHSGRMQFGLFLKGIGLPLEQAIEFWRSSFSNMSDDEFKKGYAYNIRHNYGQEGNRKDYTPYGCEKIINQVPGANDQHHGCPFRNFSAEKLKTELESVNPMVSTDEIKELNELVKKRHYNIACTRYFELAHVNPNPTIITSLPEPISHPNQYYVLSNRITKSFTQPIKTSEP